jgi:hypothetical protein
MGCVKYSQPYEPEFSIQSRSLPAHKGLHRQTSLNHMEVPMSQLIAICWC